MDTSSIQNLIASRLSDRFDRSVIPNRQYVEDAIAYYEARNNASVIPISTRELTGELVEHCAIDINSRLNAHQANAAPLAAAIDPGYNIVRKPLRAYVSPHVPRHGIGR